MAGKMRMKDDEYRRLQREADEELSDVRNSFRLTLLFHITLRSLAIF
jgi:hypothetical protein